MCFMKKEDFKVLGLANVLAGLECDGFAVGLVDPAEYHGWKKAIPNCVSKSMLHEFGENALLFHLNEVEGRKVERKGFRMGSAVDAAVLTPEVFERRYFCEEKRLALTKEGRPVANGRQDPEQRAEWEARFAKGDVLMDADEFAEVLRVAGNVRAAWGDMGLAVGENALSQVAMFVRVEEVRGERLPVPLVVCGMLDLLPLEGKVLWDLKTTSRGVAEGALNAQVAEYGYGLQAALYADLFEVCTGEVREFRFLFAEVVAPYQCRVVAMPWMAMDGYRGLYERLLLEYARCVASGDWGGPVLPEMVYEAPVWEKRRLGF